MRKTSPSLGRIAIEFKTCTFFYKHDTNTPHAKCFRRCIFIHVLRSLTKNQLYKPSETQHRIDWWRFTCCCIIMMSCDPRDPKFLLDSWWILDKYLQHSGYGQLKQISDWMITCLQPYSIWEFDGNHIKSIMSNGALSIGLLGFVVFSNQPASALRCAWVFGQEGTLGLCRLT